MARPATVGTTVGTARGDLEVEVHAMTEQVTGPAAMRTERGDLEVRTPWAGSGMLNGLVRGCHLSLRFGADGATPGVGRQCMQLAVTFTPLHSPTGDDDLGGPAQMSCPALMWLLQLLHTSIHTFTGL